MPTTRRKIDPNDPRDLAVQVTLRMPWWYREQLVNIARPLGASVPELALDAIQRAYEPEPPK
jgi:hypothetical protein